ncbi:MAG TPA: response regulator transcription factor [Planctomycetota bacterium]|nr:response regulator transcription factor [Planctomycetota bacterium]
MTHSILIIEDEQDLALGVRDALTNAGFQAEIANDGPAGLARLRSSPFDLVVLDLMLPGMNGLELLRTLRRERQDVRVLILTAMAEEDDLIAGFQAGADDYMSKPFSPRELVARVEAQFRRRDTAVPARARLDLPGGISVDLARLEVYRKGQVIPMTPREGDILEYLMRHREKVVTRDDLLVDVWHYKSPNVETRTVDIHIVGLRRKIEVDPAKPQFIQTVRGKGYRWFS